MEGRARILEIDPELRLITPDENHLKNIKQRRNERFNRTKRRGGGASSFCSIKSALRK